MQSTYDVIGDVRGRGAMIAIELVDPHTDAPDASLTSRVASTCHSSGLLVLTAGSYGNVLRFLPPLVTSDELLHDGLDVLEKALASVN